MPPFSTPSARWTAITTRDSAASNAFIYCVTSTKIFCRPTCPARLARRANVIFHDTAAEAEAAGYRACMRCRPCEINEAEGDPQRIAVTKARELLKVEGNRIEKGGEKWSVKDLAKEVGLTESHFCRIFKKITGKTVGEYRVSISEPREKTAKKATVSDNSAPAPVVWENAGPSSAFETPYIPDAVLADDALVDFDYDLAWDWHEFSGTQHLASTLDMFPGMNGMGWGDFTSPPEIISDPSTPTTTDNDLQFLDFDEV